MQIIEDSVRQAQSDVSESSRLLSDEECFINQVDQINEEAIVLIESNDYLQALQLLQKAEKMLDFLANCGKPIDRNLIIVVLYNKASVHQSQWELEKCQQFMDGVIYNVEILVNEKPQVGQQLTDFYLLKIKRLSFLAKAYLQYCAVLSQLGQHESSLLIAKKGVDVLVEVFTLSEQLCKTFLKGEKSSQRTRYQNTKSGQQMVIEEIHFKSLLLETAEKFLSQLNENLKTELQDENSQLLAAQRQVYFWKNNPENNEKHLREQLNVRMKPSPHDLRSLLGVQNELEWIEQFNIGTIMHISPMQYSQFALQGELLYEFSKKILLEKILYLSISFFTIATEMRFIEIDKNKSVKGETYQQSAQFKLSVLYHLKSIEIACKHIHCPSPYIDHLISSFYKHYNQTLEPIAEELSYISLADQDQSKQKGPQTQLKFYKSFSDHSRTEFMRDIELLNKRKQEEDLQKKKLSLEGLKNVLQQHDKLAATAGSSRTFSGFMKQSRCDTESLEKMSIRNLSINQLKKLKFELENKKKQVPPSNKSLNKLLTVGSKKLNSIDLDACRTERSQDDTKRQYDIAYAVMYPKHYQSQAPSLQSMTVSQNMTNITSSINKQDILDESRPMSQSQRSINQRLKAAATAPVIKSPANKVQRQPYLNSINIISSNTLNINSGQSYFQIRPEMVNAPRSRPTYQPLPKKSPKAQENEMHINMKIETIQALLQKCKGYTTPKV